MVAPEEWQRLELVVPLEQVESPPLVEPQPSDHVDWKISGRGGEGRGGVRSRQYRDQPPGGGGSFDLIKHRLMQPRFFAQSKIDEYTTG